MRRTGWVARAAGAAATVVLLLALTALPAAASAAVTGGGSSFAALEIDQWHADTAVHPFDLTVNYTSQGSSFGRNQFSSGNLDFGASDITYLDMEKGPLQSGRCQGRPLANCFVYVPVSAGGVAFMYNLTDSSGHRLSNLKLTRRAACKIFTGQITRWNDPELVATNPALASFSRNIIPVIRSDGAGESYVLSQFCIAVAPDIWHAFIADRQKNDPTNVAVDFAAGQPVSNWPQNWAHSLAQPYADGVANDVSSPDTGANAITYVAAGYAKVRNFPVASLQNASNFFTQPDEDNVTVALGYATPRGDGTFNLNFTGPDPRAYFPSTYSYVLAQTTGFDRSKGETLGKFLCYAISQGQVIAPSLRYARLSKPLVQIAINAIVQIPGAPDANHCFLATAPPPPPPPSLHAGTPAPPPPTAPGGSNGGQGHTGSNVGATGNATGPGGATDNAGGGQTSGASTSTTSPGQNINERLAAARQAGFTPSHHSQLWPLVLGVALAALLSYALTRRRNAS